MTTKDLSRQEIETLQAGRKEEGRGLVSHAVQQTECYEVARPWLGGELASDAQQHIYLGNAMAIYSDAAATMRGLERSIGATEVRPVGPIFPPSHTPPEEVFHADEPIRFIKGRALISGKTYALGNIAAVGLNERTAYPITRVFLLLAGLGLAIIAFFGIFDPLFALASLAAFSTRVYVLDKKLYVVKLTTSAGEITAMTTTDKEFAQTVTDALGRAIAERG